MRVELQALSVAREYFEHRGYDVSDVSRVRGHNGYDFIAEREGERLLIEVKGCSRKWQIPDFFETEFDDERRLVADVLSVVYIIDGAPESICLIPREAIPSEYIKPKGGYRISSRFKKETVLQPFLRQLPCGREGE